MRDFPTSVQVRRATADVLTVVLGLATGAVLVGFLLSLLDLSPRDDSDHPTGARSGMGVYVDYKTGCEYLGLQSVLTPRLREDGKQVCTPRPSPPPVN